MKLTIGMIVKNEEKYLDRCLSAIKPILDSVDSELIITDTGSTDRTVEIAKKYTDKVLHFDWTNDFSAARNTGIKNAHGEWFMFLDADEIFQSCDGIISFFNSGEYKRYNSATYTVRNLDNDGGYSDFEARRITKIFSETRFNGGIHEHLNTFKAPVKYIPDIADHYGYVYNDDAERSRKFERNYQLLLKKYEQVKDKNPMIYAEMYDTLATGFKQKEADEYLDKGIEWCIKNEHPLLILMYCKKARHQLFEKQNDDALGVCDAYFGMSKNIRNATLISDAEILAIKATVLYRQENWSNAAETLAAFFPVYDDIKSGKLNTKDKMYGSLSLANDKNYLSYVGQFLVCCLNSEKYDFALNTLKKLPISKYSNDRDTLDSIINLETSLLQNVDIQNLDILCNQLDEYGKKALTEAAEKMQSKKSNGKVLLTIGMIVKNEEKYLDKCLSAIKPILDNVDSELIITDTGSTDRTVEIARKYTDKVLHFDWINDFAAARNFGLEKAQGEWFMFLDADEIFRSCDDIIAFFNSGEYTNFNSAAFVCRNIYDIGNLLDYSDFNAPRLVKLMPETRFKNIVHEVPNPFLPPMKHLHDVVLHYGYAYTDNEQSANKFKRNSELLLKRLEEDPESDPMLYVQLFDCFSSVFNNTRAYEYLDKGEQLCLRTKSSVLITIYSRRIQLAFANNQYEKCIEISNNYFNIKKQIYPHTLTTDAEIYGLTASSYFKLERYEEALDDFCHLFDIYDDVLTGSLFTEDASILESVFALAKNYIPVLCDFLSCCMTTGKYELAVEYLEKLAFEKYLSYESENIKFAKKTAELAYKTEFQKTILITEKYNDALKSYFYFFIFKQIYSGNSKSQIISLLKCPADERIRKKASVYQAFLSDGAASEEELLYFAEKYTINDDPDLLYIAMKSHDDITILLNSETDIKQCVYLCAKYIDDFYDTAENYPSACIKKSDSIPDAIKFFDYCISLRLMENSDKTSEEKERLIEKLFRIKNKLNERYTCEISNKSKKTEFEQLTVMLKTNVRNLAVQGKYDDAKKFLDEYAKIAPNDPQITELYKLLN